VARLPCRTCISIQMFAKKMCFPPNHTPVPGQSFENFIKGYSILAAEPDCAQNLSDMQWSRSIFCLALISNLAIAPFGSSAAGEDRDIEIEAAGTGSGRMKFEIPSAEAQVALQQLASRADRPLVYLLDQVKGVRVNAVSGDYTLREALHRLVENTELKVVEDSMSGAWVVKPRNQVADSTAQKTNRKETKPKYPQAMKNKTNRIRRALLAGLVSVPMLLNNANLSAQVNEDEDEVEELNPFEVTGDISEGYFASASTAGTRIAAELTDIPGSVSILNAELLSDLNGYDPKRAFRFGVSGVSPNTEQRDDLQIRGFRTGQPFRDGIAVSGFFRSPTYDIDRIEVVRGPAAMTFGDSGPLGGVINFVSKKPTLQPTGSVEAIIRPDDEFYRITANASGPFSPLIPDGRLKSYAEDHNLRYRVTVGHQHDDRFKAIESDDHQFYGGAIGGDFNNTNILIESYYYKINGYLYFNDLVDMNAPPGPIRLNPNTTRSFSPSDPDFNNQDIEEFYFKTSVVTQLSERQSVKLFYRYRQHDEFRRHLRGINVREDNVTLERQDLPLFFDNDENVLQFDYLHDIKHPWIFGKEMSHQFSAGAQWIKQVNGTRLSVFDIAPIDVRNPDFSNDKNIPVFTGPNPEQDFSRNTDSEGTETSWYVQTVTEVWGDKLLGIGGFRWIRGNEFTTNFNNPVGEGRFSCTDDTFYPDDRSVC